MKKINNIYRSQSINDLLKVKSAVTLEIAKLRVESSVKPNKDTNLIGKKRRELAVINTFLQQKELGVDNSQT